MESMCRSKAVQLAVVLCLITAGCGTKQKNGAFITVRIKNLEVAATICLNFYNGDQFIPVDSLVTDKIGEVTFRREQHFETGMYSAGIKGRNGADFFISSSGNQHFSVSFNPNNPLQTLSFRNSAENEAFAGHMKRMESAKKKMDQLQSRMQRNYRYPDSVQAIRNSVKKIQAEANAKTSELEKQFPGSMLALFLKAGSEPEIPEPVIPMIIPNREQVVQQYYYNQAVARFFDNFDFSDNRLINLPVLRQKIGFYFTQLLPPHPDTLKYRIEGLLSEKVFTPVVYTWCCKYLYKLFRESPFPELSVLPVYIGENFMLKKQNLFNDSSFIFKVSNYLEKAKLNPVGSVAANLKLQTPEGKTIELHSLKAEQIVLYFFNPGCEACHAVTDKLINLYNIFKNSGLKVYAVYVDRNREEWMKYISSKKLDWINVYDPTGIEGIEQKYDISAIPMIYLLDRDKRVAMKDVSVAKLENFFNKE